jgi:thiol-disulfide isomerase/thioredoxin
MPLQKYIERIRYMDSLIKTKATGSAKQLVTNKKIILICIISLHGLSIYCQKSYRLQLTYIKGRDKTYSYEIPILNNKPTEYKFDETKFSEHVVKKFSFQPNQNIYNKYLTGEITRDSSIKRLLYLDLDTLNLSDKYLRNSVYLLFGKDTSGQIHLIVDANNNFDFKDDIDLIVKSGDTIPYRGEYEFFYKPLVRKRLIDIKFLIFSTGHLFEDSLENKWRLSMQSDYHMEGVFLKSPSEKIKMQFVSDGINLYFNEKLQFIYFNITDSAIFKLDNINSFTYKLKDTFAIGKSFFKLDSVDNLSDIGFISEVKAYNTNFGWRVGNHLKQFKFIDQNQHLFSTKNKSYTLIEFWGTWCGPCKELLPQIKNDLYELKKKGISYYSFANEYGSKENFNKFLVDNEINWSNVYVTSANEYNYLLKDLKVISYPLFILKDANDKILFRDAGTDGYIRLKKFIDKKIK